MSLTEGRWDLSLAGIGFDGQKNRTKLGSPRLADRPQRLFEGCGCTINHIGECLDGNPKIRHNSFSSTQDGP